MKPLDWFALIFWGTMIVVVWHTWGAAAGLILFMVIATIAFTLNHVLTRLFGPDW